MPPITKKTEITIINADELDSYRQAQVLNREGRTYEIKGSVSGIYQLKHKLKRNPV